MSITGIRIKDLCLEDRNRIAQLIQTLSDERDHRKTAEADLESFKTLNEELRRMIEKLTLELKKSEDSRVNLSVSVTNLKKDNDHIIALKEKNSYLQAEMSELKDAIDILRQMPVQRRPAPIMIDVSTQAFIDIRPSTPLKNDETCSLSLSISQKSLPAPTPISQTISHLLQSSPSQSAALPTTNPTPLPRPLRSMTPRPSAPLPAKPLPPSGPSSFNSSLLNSQPLRGQQIQSLSLGNESSVSGSFVNPLQNRNEVEISLNRNLLNNNNNSFNSNGNQFIPSSSYMSNPYSNYNDNNNQITNVRVLQDRSALQREHTISHQPPAYFSEDNSFQFLSQSAQNQNNQLKTQNNALEQTVSYQNSEIPQTPPQPSPSNLMPKMTSEHLPGIKKKHHRSNHHSKFQDNKRSKRRKSRKKISGNRRHSSFSNSSTLDSDSSLYSYDSNDKTDLDPSSSDIEEIEDNDEKEHFVKNNTSKTSKRDLAVKQGSIAAHNSKSSKAVSSPTKSSSRTPRDMKFAVVTSARGPTILSRKTPSTPTLQPSRPSPRKELAKGPADRVAASILASTPVIPTSFSAGRLRDRQILKIAAPVIQEARKKIAAGRRREGNNNDNLQNNSGSLGFPKVEIFFKPPTEIASLNDSTPPSCLRLSSINPVQHPLHSGLVNTASPLHEQKTTTATNELSSMKPPILPIKNSLQAPLPFGISALPSLASPPRRLSPPSPPAATESRRLMMSPPHPVTPLRPPLIMNTTQDFSSSPVSSSLSQSDPSAPPILRLLTTSFHEDIPVRHLRSAVPSEVLHSTVEEITSDVDSVLGFVEEKQEESAFQTQRTTLHLKRTSSESTATRIFTSSHQAAPSRNSTVVAKNENNDSIITKKTVVHDNIPLQHYNNANENNSNALNEDDFDDYGPSYMPRTTRSPLRPNSAALDLSVHRNFIMSRKIDILPSQDQNVTVRSSNPLAMHVVSWEEEDDDECDLYKHTNLIDDHHHNKNKRIKEEENIKLNKNISTVYSETVAPPPLFPPPSLISQRFSLPFTSEHGTP